MLLARGKLCKGCITKCEPQRVFLECPFCGGRRCEKCGDTGKWQPDGCPRKQVTPDIRRLLSYSVWAKGGSLPSAGGVLDQTVSFEAGCRRVWNYQNQLDNDEVERWRKKT